MKSPLITFAIWVVLFREKALAKKAAAEGAGQKFSGQIPPVPSLEAFNFSYGGVLNVNAVDNKHPLVRGDPDSLFLVETLPGDFVLYGASWAMGPAGLHICFCLGTVGFTARPGEVLDLGTFFAEDGAAYRVNGGVKDGKLVFFINPADANADYDRLEGIQFVLARLENPKAKSTTAADFVSLEILNDLAQRGLVPPA